VECAAAVTYPLAGVRAAFCDPARRGGGRRVFDPRAYSPPFDFLLELAAAVPMTGAKVAPGIPHALVPAGAEAEWISDEGEVKEAALWFGPLATAARRATLLPSGATITTEGARLECGPLGRYLYEPDGAVIRSHLVAEAGRSLGARLIDPEIAYLTADSLTATPFAKAYEITDSFGFSLKRLRAVLRAQDVGTVTIKKRGSALDPATLRRQLRLSGSREATVVLTRVAGAPTVLLCQPAAG
ncbi:MAG TPA: class I SAM-dependent methyltransferase, partial [Mycobacteriales bacterium]|nr:class I SAM-dependent methyltransferase [Mycobacteriales bacterium]